LTLLRFILATPRKPPASIYQKVFDSRKRRVRGLWQRNGKYFANLTVADDLGRKNSRWVPLAGTSFTDAKEDYDRLRVERVDDRLRPMGLTPTLRDYITVSYTPQAAASGKRASSLEKEASYLRRWSEKIGHLRLNKIRAHHLNKYLTELAGKTYSGRTINLFLIAIRAVLKAALRDGHLNPHRFQPEAATEIYEEARHQQSARAFPNQISHAVADYRPSCQGGMGLSPRNAQPR